MVSVPLGRGKFTTLFYVQSKSGGVIQANVPTRPVAGGGAGGAQASPEILRLELIFAIKVEFWY